MLQEVNKVHQGGDGDLKWVHRMGAGGWSLAKLLLKDAEPKLQVYHGMYLGGRWAS